MAVDVCSELPSARISPRISFSHDLKPPTDCSSIREHHNRLDTSLLESDFNFCFANNFVQELSSADELFANGKIRPLEIKKSLNFSKDKDDQPMLLPPSRPHQTSSETKERKLLKEFLSMSTDPEEKPAPKSFWQFKRSSSLNFDSARSKGLIRSLQFLSRSNSTGSAPNPQKQSTLAKDTQKPKLQKQPSLPNRKLYNSNSGLSYHYNSSQKNPPLRKCKSYGNGVRISPVLNISPPCISRGTINLFGLGSLFCNGKFKKKKR